MGEQRGVDPHRGREHQHGQSRRVVGEQRDVDPPGAGNTNRGTAGEQWVSRGTWTPQGRGTPTGSEQESGG